MHGLLSNVRCIGFMNNTISMQYYAILCMHIGSVFGLEEYKSTGSTTVFFTRCDFIAPGLGMPMVTFCLRPSGKGLGITF
jgi:hypothetical protein